MEVILREIRMEEKSEMACDSLDTAGNSQVHGSGCCCVHYAERDDQSPRGERRNDGVRARGVVSVAGSS